VSHVISPDGIKIDYEVIGHDSSPDNRRTIIFAHGNGNCKDDWKDTTLNYVQTLIDSDYRVILVDQRGYGKSEKPHQSNFYTPELVSSDFLTVIDQVFGNDKKCHFFGNSRGGNIGFALMAHHQDRFHSFMVGGAKTSLSESTLQFPKLLENGIDVFVDKIKGIFGKDFPAGLEARFRQNDAKSLIAANTSTWPDYENILSKVHVPCMFFIGELDPDCAALEAASKKLQDCEFHKLLGLDHAKVYWQRGEPKTVDLVKDFLKRRFEIRS
jgi:pimeloyl-ACP methyl ester carboxylesterase